MGLESRWLNDYETQYGADQRSFLVKQLRANLRGFRRDELETRMMGFIFEQYCYYVLSKCDVGGKLLGPLMTLEYFGRLFGGSVHPHPFKDSIRGRSVPDGLVLDRWGRASAVFEYTFATGDNLRNHISSSLQNLGNLCRRQEFENATIRIFVCSQSQEVMQRRNRGGVVDTVEGIGLGPGDFLNYATGIVDNVFRLVGQ